MRSLIFRWMSRNPTLEAHAATCDPLIIAEDLEVRPPAADGRRSRLSFTLSKGATLFLVGPKGSGKSAALDLLSFHGAPARGRLELLGDDPTRLSPRDRPRMRRRVGFVFQDQRLFSDLDVFGNVAIAGRAADRRREDCIEEANQLLTWVGLGGRGKDRITQLDDAERSRLCLARALINSPEILLVDEPTAGLDDKASRSLVRLIAAVGGAGTAVVFATRNPNLIQIAGAAVCRISDPFSL